MAAERCPLCQSKLKNGECLSCGYRPPSEGDISALYNYDPSDYPQEQPVREIMPDVQMEEIYPGRPEMPDIKVHDGQNNTTGMYGAGLNKEAWQKVREAQQAKQDQEVQQTAHAQQTREAWHERQARLEQQRQQKQIHIPDEVAHLFDENGNFLYERSSSPKGKIPDDIAHLFDNSGNFDPQRYKQIKNQDPYANLGKFSPYHTNQTNNQNPYANNGNFRPYQKHPTWNNVPPKFSNQVDQEDFSSYGEFFKKYWWALLLSFLTPMAGILCYAIFRRKMANKYSVMFFVAVALGRIVLGF